eukprot:Skav209544  [mRNA]  locus=scaffold2497:141850:143934:+ [translate_table: standard]
MAHGDIWDGRSIASRSSCLTNAVESLLGHAAAKGIASDVDLINRTLKKGYKMITHASNGFDSTDKPYRWMSLRYVSFEEVLSLTSVQKTFEGHAEGCSSQQLQELQGAAGLWHFVICNFKEKSEKDPQVDDPRIIEAALGDEEFVQLLQQYFESSDTENQKWFKTLATLVVFEGYTLLHFCCKRGLIHCVEYLLKKHSVFTATQPWLQLADPLWQDRRWGNSAFSRAAYCGDVEMLNVLLNWAHEHDQLEKALQLKDKHGQDLFQILEGRIAKRDGAKGNPKLAHNLLSQACGRQPSYPEAAGLGANVSADVVAMVIVDPPKSTGDPQNAGYAGENSEDQRLAYPLDAQMTLVSLSEFFAKLQAEEQVLRGRSVLIINLKLLPQDGKDQEAAHRLLSSLRDCCRVGMKNCFCNPELCLTLGEATARQLNADPVPAWESIGFLPQWDVHPGSDSPLLEKFADVLEMMFNAAEHTFERDFIGFELNRGIRSCLPWERVHVTTLLGNAFRPKQLAHSLRWERTRTKKLKDNLRKDFKAFNCLLSGVAALERFFVVKQTLIDSTSVEHALHPSWKWYVGRLIPFWLKQVTSMKSLNDSWGQERDPEMAAVICQIAKMLEGAVVHLLKMRPKDGRPGINGMCQVVKESLDSNVPQWPSLLPEVADYMKKISPE